QESKPGGKLAPVLAFLEEADNKELLTLLADAGSQEIFCYGGDGWVGFLELVQHVYGAVQYEPIKAQLEGNFGRNPSHLQARAALQALEKHPELVRVPDLVFGGRLTDPKRVEKQL